jgi:hypothetical protein
MAKFRRAVKTTAAGEIGRFLSGLSAGIQSQQKIELARQKQQGASAQDMITQMLMSQLVQQSPTTAGQVSSVGSVAGQTPTQGVAQAAAGNQQVEALLNRQFPSGQMIPTKAKIGGVTLEDVGTGIDADVARQQAMLPGKVSEQESTIRTKEGIERKVEAERSAAALGTTTDEFLNMSVERMNTTGIKPGFGAGVVSKLTPAEENKHKEAFRGSRIETAAQVAAIAIPGVRAARVVNVFSQSAPSEFSTLESGINNSMVSLERAIQNDVIANQQEYGIESGNPLDIAKQAQEISKKVALQFRDAYYKRAYRADPRLFSDRKSRSIAKALVEEEDIFLKLDESLMGGK